MNLESAPDFYLKPTGLTAQLRPIYDLRDCAQDLQYKVMVFDLDGHEFSTLVLDATLFKPAEAEALGFDTEELLSNYSADTAYLAEALYEVYQDVRGEQPDLFQLRPEVEHLLELEDWDSATPSKLLYIHTDSIVETLLGCRALLTLLNNHDKGLAVVCISGLDEIENSHPVFDNTERRMEAFLTLGFRHIENTPFMIYDLSEGN